MDEPQEVLPTIYPTDDPQTVAAKKRELNRIFDAQNASNAARRAAIQTESEQRKKAKTQADREAAAQEREKRQAIQDARAQKQRTAEAVKSNEDHWYVHRHGVRVQGFLLSLIGWAVVISVVGLNMPDHAWLILILGPIQWVFIAIWWSNRYKRSIPARRVKEQKRFSAKSDRAAAKEAKLVKKYDW